MKKAIFIGFLLLFLVTPFDNQILSYIIAHRIDTLNSIMVWFSYAGTGYAVFLITTLLFFWEKNKRDYIPLIWISLLAAMALTYILKITIAHPRPYLDSLVIEDGYSFPSGHASAVFSVLAIINSTFPKAKWFWLVFAFLIAFSRLYLGVHFPSDVVAGALLGYLTGLIFLHYKEPIIKYFKIKRII